MVAGLRGHWILWCCQSDLGSLDFTVFLYWNEINFIFTHNKKYLITMHGTTWIEGTHFPILISSTSTNTPCCVLSPPFGRGDDCSAVEAAWLWACTVAPCAPASLLKKQNKCLFSAGKEWEPSIPAPGEHELMPTVTWDFHFNRWGLHHDFPAGKNSNLSNCLESSQNLGDKCPH